MPLTIAERLHQMPHGAQAEVVRELGLSRTYVSAVMNDEVRPKTEPTRLKLRETQEALAAKLGRPVDEVFPEANQEAAPLAHAP
jgi:transcriptional regulator with XRE-family HTH domain